jgi:hypothetical protein
MPTDDIAEQMRYRAIKGYGLDVTKNLAIVKDNPSLHSLWNWIQRILHIRLAKPKSYTLLQCPSS